MEGKEEIIHAHDNTNIQNKTQRVIDNERSMLPEQKKGQVMKIAFMHMKIKVSKSKNKE